MPERPDSHGLDWRLLKRLTGMLRPYWGMAVGAFTLIIGAALFETAIPLVTRHAIDVDIADGDLEGLRGTILVFLLTVGLVPVLWPSP